MTHYKMLSEYQLANFANLMKATRGFPLSDLAPGGAFDTLPPGMSRRAKDAKPRPAKDEDGEGAARRVVNMLMALKEQLGDETFQGLCERLCEGDESDEPEAEGEDDDPAAEFTSPMEREMDAAKDKKAKDKKAKDKKAKNSPPDFEGMPKTGAMDAASDKRFDFVADAMRVKPSQPGAAYGDISSKGRHAPVTASAERSFGEMYGAAALDIKVR